METKRLLTLCLVLFCLHSSIDILYGQSSDKKEMLEYEIKRIKKKNNWFFIYATRNDSIFKIVSEKPADKEPYSHCQKIRKHQKYKMELTSFYDLAPVFNGVKMYPMGYSGGFGLDRRTVVMLEPEKNIWDIYITPNLRGRYYIPQ